ncbi:unnamed protein product [Durusdinium trenchii]|uniref:Uncharacterized protein n=1 Tax=Durusdinium trenchii TaxID=1381693 RepID=A0ABP0SZL2_9DINO
MLSSSISLSCGSSLLNSAFAQRSWRAAAVMAESALDRLRPYTVPAKYVDIPPLRGSEEALLDFLGDDARLVFNFLSQVERLSPAGQAFWQAELYLRQLDEIAGETEVLENHIASVVYNVTSV